LRNVYSGIFAQYANFGWAPSELDPPVDDRPPLDRWVLSRLAAVEAEANARLTEYDATAAARTVTEFVEGDLSKWYVRQSRARFYDVDQPDNRAAFATLHEVLTVVCRLLAPVAPFVTDWIHRELTGASVHLASYGRSNPGTRDPRLERAMDDVRQLATLGRAARDVVGINVRQPLSRVVCVVPGGPAGLESLVPLLKTELNVKHVEFLTSADSLVTLSAKANFRALGKKFGKSTPLAAQAIQALTSADLRAFQTGDPIGVTVDGQTHQLDADDLTIAHRAAGNLAVEEARGYVAAIDPARTPALIAEGMARELIREVQVLRKETGLAVSDRIRLAVWGDPVVEEAVRSHGEWIGGEVLARTLLIGEGTGSFDANGAVDLDGHTVHFALTREVES
jgi:isoleucyl-tRNA synthetase